MPLFPGLLQVLDLYGTHLTNGQKKRKKRGDLGGGGGGCPVFLIQSAVPLPAKAAIPPTCVCSTGASSFMRCVAWGRRQGLICPAMSISRTIQPASSSRIWRSAI